MRASSPTPSASTRPSSSRPRPPPRRRARSRTPTGACNGCAPRSPARARSARSGRFSPICPRASAPTSESAPARWPAQRCSRPSRCTGRSRSKSWVVTACAGRRSAGRGDAAGLGDRRRRAADPAAGCRARRAAARARQLPLDMGRPRGRGLARAGTSCTPFSTSRSRPSTPRRLGIPRRRRMLVVRRVRRPDPRPRSGARRGARGERLPRTRARRRRRERAARIDVEIVPIPEPVEPAARPTRTPARSRRRSHDAWRSPATSSRGGSRSSRRC